MTPYSAFLASKRLLVGRNGPAIEPAAVNEILFPFQRDLVAWAVRKGRAALFADTGLGKTFMQLEWARLIGERTLIVAPLSVARQTSREAMKLGMAVHYSRGDLFDGISITNYEMVEHFDPADYGAVVLDESSILKALEGKTRRRLIELFAATPYRLCCTATPAPNDISEIGNHAEFLGVMAHHEMLSAFFVHGSMGEGEKDGWRLKGHAEDAFYRWLASWGMAVRRPSDLGYDDAGFALPDLSIRAEFVESHYVPEGQLFFAGLKGVTDRAAVRRGTTEQRVAKAADLVNHGSTDQWIVWHGLNDEGDALVRSIPGAVMVEGSQSPEEKAAALEAFQDGAFRVLVTKPSIAGFGMNFQNAHRMAFVGLSDSWESYYQAIRRCWRFGQTEPVEAVIVLSEPEAAIYENVMGKEREALRMQERLIEHVATFEREELEGAPDGTDYHEATVEREGWTMMLGDSAERIRELGDASIDLSVFSPPFASLFTYSPSERDMGNSRGDEFWQHFGYLIRDLLRVTKPGRNCAVHVQQIPTTVTHDGVTGLRDFRGETIANFIANGWTFHGEVTIDKDPQAQAIRTKAKGLLFVQKERDRSWLRPAFADYILVFRKPGENAEPIRSDEVSNDDWIEWARPIWYGIRESATLNAAEAREQRDERHIAALQLETVRRCILLWSNRDELLLDPFAGIGTTGYVALQNERRFIGCELKRSYFEAACRNIERASNVLTLGLEAIPA